MMIMKYCSLRMPNNIATEFTHKLAVSMEHLPLMVHTMGDGDECIGPWPGPNDMAPTWGCAALEDGIIGGICSVWRCNIAYKTSHHNSQHTLVHLHINCALMHLFQPIPFYDITTDVYIYIYIYIYIHTYIHTYTCIYTTAGNTWPSNNTHKCRVSHCKTKSKPSVQSVGPAAVSQSL